MTLSINNINSAIVILLWNQVDALQKHLQKDHVHMRLWTRLYGMYVITADIIPVHFKSAKHNTHKQSFP